MSGLDDVLGALEERVGFTDPRNPVVSDAFRAMRGLPPEPGWGAHCGLPLFLTMAACRDAERTLALVRAGGDWRSLADLVDHEVFEIGGSFVEPLGGRWVDARYRGTHVQAGTLDEAPADVILANAVFEEGSGIVRTLVDLAAAKAVPGLDYGSWRAEASRAASLELLMALRPMMRPGSVLLASNVLSPMCVPDVHALEHPSWSLPSPAGGSPPWAAPASLLHPQRSLTQRARSDDMMGALGLQALRPRFVERTHTRFGVLQTEVRVLICVGPRQETVVGPSFFCPHRGRVHRVYEGGQGRWAQRSERPHTAT